MVAMFMSKRTFCIGAFSLAGLSLLGGGVHDFVKLPHKLSEPYPSFTSNDLWVKDIATKHVFQDLTRLSAYGLLSNKEMFLVAGTMGYDDKAAKFIAEYDMRPVRIVTERDDVVSMVELNLINGNAIIRREVTGVLSPILSYAVETTFQDWHPVKITSSWQLAAKELPSRTASFENMSADQYEHGKSTFINAYVTAKKVFEGCVEAFNGNVDARRRQWDDTAPYVQHDAAISPPKP